MQNLIHLQNTQDIGDCRDARVQNQQTTCFTKTLVTSQNPTYPAGINEFDIRHINQNTLTITTVLDSFGKRVSERRHVRLDDPPLRPQFDGVIFLRNDRKLEHETSFTSVSAGERSHGKRRNAVSQAITVRHPAVGGDQ